MLHLPVQQIDRVAARYVGCGCSLFPLVVQYSVGDRPSDSIGFLDVDGVSGILGAVELWVGFTAHLMDGRHGTGDVPRGRGCGVEGCIAVVGQTHHKFTGANLGRRLACHESGQREGKN